MNTDIKHQCGTNIYKIVILQEKLAIERYLVVTLIRIPRNIFSHCSD